MCYQYHLLLLCFSYRPSPSTPSPSSWLPPTSQLASCETSQWVRSEACIPGLADCSMFARRALQPASSWVQGTAATSVARALRCFEGWYGLCYPLMGFNMRHSGKRWSRTGEQKREMCQIEKDQIKDQNKGNQIR